jgi:peptidoglycan hydrolase-like protein with peptidoglycan-binding domain
MYMLLRKGDRLPTVGVLQTLLNRQIAGKKLVVDGIFGEKTKKTVIDFKNHGDSNRTVLSVK